MQEKLTNIYYRSYYKENNDALLLKTLFDFFFLCTKIYLRRRRDTLITIKLVIIYKSVIDIINLIMLIANNL
jgi:hypothetical protein